MGRFIDPSGVLEFETTEDRHVERRRDVLCRTLNFPRLAYVLYEEQVPPLDWMVDGTSV
jgi:hypothetical protein